MYQLANDMQRQLLNQPTIGADVINCSTAYFYHKNTKVKTMAENLVLRIDFLMLNKLRVKAKTSVSMIGWNIVSKFSSSRSCSMGNTESIHCHAGHKKCVLKLKSIFWHPVVCGQVVRSSRFCAQHFWKRELWVLLLTRNQHTVETIKNCCYWKN